MRRCCWPPDSEAGYLWRPPGRQDPSACARGPGEPSPAGPASALRVVRVETFSDMSRRAVRESASVRAKVADRTGVAALSPSPSRRNRTSRRGEPGRGPWTVSLRRAVRAPCACRPRAAGELLRLPLLPRGAGHASRARRNKTRRPALPARAFHPGQTTLCLTGQAFYIGESQRMKRISRLRCALPLPRAHPRVPQIPSPQPYYPLLPPSPKPPA